MTNSLKSHTLGAPGATLYYETRGSGPLLVMIPGGPTDAGVFGGLAECLADRYRVAAYDPRGNSRSIFDGAPKEQDLDVHGDDAARLIEVLGGGPAFVFGSSGGAQIGLNLAARHPERVRTLVAHEPPCVRMLADSSEIVAGTEAVYDAYRAEGIGSAMQKFMQMAGMGDGPPRQDGPPGQGAPPPEAMAAMARIGANMDYFLAHGIRPISFYTPDVPALRAGPVRVVVGVGESSKGQLAYRAAGALAEALEAETVTFPGDHGGYGAHPQAFAETLDWVLRGG